MQRSLGRGALVGVVTALSILASASACHADEPTCCLTLDRLQRMSPDQLAALFAATDVGRPPVGRATGKVLCLPGQRLPGAKVWLTNAIWKGKILCDDGSFINHWLTGVRALPSTYAVGPSWVDGKPAIIMEYRDGTPILGNTRDELREVAPGLYLGPYFDRAPCPKLHGYLALQICPVP